MREDISIPDSDRRRVGPLPPDDLVVRTGVDPSRFTDLEARLARFDEIGRDVYAYVAAVLPPGWEWPRKAILDFGCGSGRLLRWLLPHVDDGAKLTGCDIHEPSIRWLRQQYPEAVRLYANDAGPPLPERADSFDLVCAVSVFTHLTNWAPWLLELRRVLAPGGILVVSVLGRAAWESSSSRARGVEWDEDHTGLLVEQYGSGFEDGYGPAVFASEWWLREHWGRAFDLDRVDARGQVWVVARKRLDDASPPTSEELVAPGDDPREAPAAQRAQWIAYEELASARGRI
jgi:SAM-dependent methyltransferase